MWKKVFIAKIDIPSNTLCGEKAGIFVLNPVVHLVTADI